jgi:hypothetical protein
MLSRSARNATLAGTVLIAALILCFLAACSKDEKDQKDLSAHFEPVTCSTTPSPCA